MVLSAQKKAPRNIGPTHRLENITSRDFGRQDHTMLAKAGIIDERGRQLSPKALKVKKKDPTTSRFITDCRAFNDGRSREKR